MVYNRLFIGLANASRQKQKNRLIVVTQRIFPSRSSCVLSQKSSVNREFILGKTMMVHRFSEGGFGVTVILTSRQTAVCLFDIVFRRQNFRGTKSHSFPKLNLKWSGPSIRGVSKGLLTQTIKNYNHFKTFYEAFITLYMGAYSISQHIKHAHAILLMTNKFQIKICLIFLCSSKQITKTLSYFKFSLGRFIKISPNPLFCAVLQEM